MLGIRIAACQLTNGCLRNLLQLFTRCSQNLREWQHAVYMMRVECPYYCFRVLHLFSMRFAIATNDGYQYVLEAFLRAGWQMEKLFVSRRTAMSDNKQVILRALELGVDVQRSPVTSRDLADLGQRG